MEGAELQNIKGIGDKLSQKIIDELGGEEELNQVINEAIAVVQPPTDKGRRLKILYGTQVSTKPPTFVIFVNDKELFHFSYERYIINQIRKEFGLEGTPVRVIIREKSEKDVYFMRINKKYFYKKVKDKLNEGGLESINRVL